MYLSSACVKHEYIKDSVNELAQNGFKDIELSGGTKYYLGYEDDLLRLKEKYHLNYLVHNYFPPPPQDFILNLASLDDDVYHKSLEHCHRAIALSQKLGASKFCVHAGFFINIKTSEIGKNLSASELFNKDKAMGRFCEGYTEIKKAARGIDIYIENNVLSLSNMKTFQNQNPLMLTDYQGYLELKSLIEFKLLLDVAHLNVSANSLGIDYAEQLNNMLALSDYVHVSDNDGLHDQSQCFQENSKILNILKKQDLRGKTMTMETYGSLENIKQSQALLERTLRLN